MKKADQSAPREKKVPADDCIVPPEIPKGELHKLMFRPAAPEVRSIHEYVEWQAPDEKVLHAEKLASERVFGRDYDVWDVHTDKERWWVVTSPTNLYSQKLMPSMDYVLSFHIGLMARVQARRVPEGSEARQEFLLVTNRKLVQASESLDAADEAEEFQAVGMQCRECLLALIRELVDGSDLESGEDLPKKSDFKGWAERIANVVAAGGSADYVRGYLKAVADRSWQLTNWLTHTSNATRGDAELAVDATEHVIAVFASAILKRAAAAPERCPRCKSYKITVDWRPELGSSGLYVPRCESCGAENLPPNASNRARKPSRSKTKAKR
jgi:hypothetical protein